MIALLYKRLLQLGKVAGALGFLFGIPYGLFQYLEAKDDMRIGRALDQFKQFNSAPFTTYREHVLAAISANKERMFASAKDPKQLEKVVLEMIASKSIESDLLLLMDFFDGVAICVVNNLCDSETVQQLFSKRARELYVNFYQYIVVHRQTFASADFGIGLETVAAVRPKGR